MSDAFDIFTDAPEGESGYKNSLDSEGDDKYEQESDDRYHRLLVLADYVKKELYALCMDKRDLIDILT